MLRKLFQRSCSLLESSSLGMSNVSASSVLLDARMAACARAFSDQPSSSSSAVGGSSSSSTPSTSSAISILSPEREELLKRVLGDSCKGGREIRKQRLNEVSERFKVHERDCGSPEFQISRLSADLALYSRLLSGNQRKNFRLKAHRQKMEHRQGKLLRYLRRLDFGRYYDTITALSLPDTHAAVTYHQRYAPRVRWEVVEAALASGLEKDEILRKIEDADKADRKALQDKGLHPIPPSVPRSRAGFAPSRPPGKKGRGRI